MDNVARMPVAEVVRQEVEQHRGVTALAHLLIERDEPSRILPMGVALMAFGGGLALLALWHFHLVNLSIARGRVRPNRALILAVALTVAFLSVLIIIYLLLTMKSG